MELICEKFKEKVNSEDPVCSHQEDYCKFRTACLIHFMEREKKLEKKNKRALDKKKSEDSISD